MGNISYVSSMMNYTSLSVKMQGLFPGLDGHRKEIFPGWHGAGGKGTEGAGRIVGPVEIQDDPPRGVGHAVHEPAGAIGFHAGGCISKYQEIAFSGFKWVKGELLSPYAEVQFSGTIVRFGETFHRSLYGHDPG